ncbi:MAG: hypothetical protein LC749_20670 [Actinobacteria bacterium]|nr:hypothetical protein [Actinomycetota bacterium]
MDVIRHLRESGVEADQVAIGITTGLTSRRANAVVELRVDAQQYSFAVEERKRAPYPAEVDALAPLKSELDGAAGRLLVAPFISQGTGRRLIAAGWSWADVAGNFDLRAPGLLIRQRLAANAPKPTKPSLPRGSGSWTVIRWLIMHGEITSLGELAVKAGVTQPRISQVGAQLEGLGLVTRTRRRWQADREQLLDIFLEEYPGPGGSEAYLYSIDDLLDWCLRLAERRPRLSMAVSADVAADLLVPWRRPTVVVVYTEAVIDLERGLGATPAHGRGDANVIHRVPDDRSVFAPEMDIDVQGVGLPLVDPVQVLWELQALGGDDRMEQAEKLRQWLLSSP